MANPNTRFNPVVADDHKLSRAGIVQSLTAQGYIDVVAEAEDGLVAIAVASQYKPDLLTPEIAMA